MIDGEPGDLKVRRALRRRVAERVAERVAAAPFLPDEFLPESLPFPLPFPLPELALAAGVAAPGVEATTEPRPRVSSPASEEVVEPARKPCEAWQRKLREREVG